MYGLIKTCNFNSEKRKQWLSHYCGLCLALSRGHGQLSRLTTNSDSVIISALCEAQNSDIVEKTSHFCLLRKKKNAEIITPDSSTSQYAAVISALIASSKIHDNIVDGDSWICQFPGLFKRITSQWSKSIRGVAEKLNVQINQIEESIYKQSALESISNKDFYFYSQGIETASGVACSQTAVISDNPQNSKDLFELGKMYGRIIYLLDSYKDYNSDRQKQVFNPLAEHLSSINIQERAKQIFYSAYEKLMFHFNKLQLPQPDLCKVILEKNLIATGNELLSDGPFIKTSSPNRRNNSWYECCDCFNCCDCSFCEMRSSGDACDCGVCDCCGCDCSC